MEYKKISDTEFEIIETVVRKTPMTINKLKEDKESLLRTIENNNRHCAQENQKILGMIAKIDEALLDAKKIGVIEVAEVIKEDEVAEEVKEA